MLRQGGLLMRAPRSATSDVIVIGAGIAGASAAHALQRDCSVRLLEAERHPGSHTTGRSAAFLVESYGNPVVQRLTRAGRGFLESPPDGFCDVPILKPRPSLTIARPDQCQRLVDDTKLALEAGVRLEQVGPGDVERICPSLRPDYCAAAVLEPRAMSIDVAALLAAFLRGFRERGGVLERERRVTGLSWDAGLWQVSCGQEVYRAPVVVNAAGAWGEEIGRLAGARPIGLQPLRRTIVTFDPPPRLNTMPSLRYMVATAADSGSTTSPTYNRSASVPRTRAPLPARVIQTVPCNEERMPVKADA